MLSAVIVCGIPIAHATAANPPAWELPPHQFIGQPDQQIIGKELSAGSDYRQKVRPVGESEARELGWKIGGKRGRVKSLEVGSGAKPSLWNCSNL